MIRKTGLAVVVATVVMSGCANQAPSKTQSAQEPLLSTKAISPTSKFAKLRAGMSIKEVNAAIGFPDDTDSHESGKRWIPFYFGNDARRLEALYKNEGCLIFAGGNIFGGNAEGELKEIQVDPSGACFRQ